MNMKKTLIALAVVAASSAGVAHAALENFAPGTLDRTVNIGGMISKSDMSGKWEWAVGTGLNHYQSTTKDVEQIDDKWQLSITTFSPLITHGNNIPIRVRKGNLRDGSVATNRRCRKSFSSTTNQNWLISGVSNTQLPFIIIKALQKT